MTPRPGVAAADAVPVTPHLLREWGLPSPAGTKDQKGRLLIVGGSTSTPGAVLLAAEAALRVGAGKVQVATSSATAAHLAVALPECLVVGVDTSPATGELAATAAGRLLELADGTDAVLVGPGLGDPGAACALLEAFVPSLDAALVVDALGTAYLTAHADGVRHLTGRVLLTPNAAELAEVLDDDADAVADDPLPAAARVAERTGATVLSGTETSFVVAPGGDAWRLDVGAPGAAAAGSGDVKAGAVAGLLARGLPPPRAACWGAHLHGRAGERLTAAMGRSGFLARELAGQLPWALGEVEA